MNNNAIVKILKNSRTPVITVFGDFCLDKYQYVDITKDELSVETDLVAFQVTHQRVYAGAGGTIANNLRALGATVYCVGIIGDDGEGYDLVKCLEDVGADTTLMVHTGERCTCAYVKPMRYGNGNTREMNRHDLKNFTPTPMSIQQQLLDNLYTAAQMSDAVIICDQYEEADCAAVTEYIREQIFYIAKNYNDVIFYADSRNNIDKFTNCIVKCNHKELARIFGINDSAMDKKSALLLAAKLYEKNSKPVYITFGERGSALFDGGNHEIPAFRAEEPVDITGAGDACNAGIVFSLTKGATYEQAGLVGNAASSIVVKQLGITGTASLKEVINLLERI